MQVFVSSFPAPSCNVSCLAARPTRSGFSLATFLLHFATFLAAASLPKVLSSILAAFATLRIPVLTLGQSPTFLCQFLCGQPAERCLRSFGLLLGSHSHNLLSLPFQSPLERLCHVSCFWLSDPSLSCQDVLQRNNEFTVRHRRPSEPVVQQSLWHQLLDREHLLLVPDLAESVLKLGHFIRERPQDVVKLLHVLCSVPFREVADQCCIC